MKPENIIKLIIVLMLLYAINLKTNFLVFNQADYEYAQVIEAKTVMTSAVSVNYIYGSKGKINTLRVRLHDGKTIPVNIGNQPLPRIGSIVQLKVYKKLSKVYLLCID